MATTARKMSKGVRVTLRTLPGETFTCFVPNELVEQARELYVAYQEADAACWAGLASEQERDEAKKVFFRYIVEVRRAAYSPVYGVNPEVDPSAWRAAVGFWDKVEADFIDLFKNRFERGL